MKRFLKSFTFYFFILGLIIICLNLAGQDDKNVLLIGINPILVWLDNPNTRPIINEVPYLWHILSLVTMSLYGVLFDWVRILIKKRDNTDV